MIKDNITSLENVSDTRQEEPSFLVKKPGAIWRALYVNSRAEKKVMESLVAKGVEAYVPLVKTMRQWSDRKKSVELPLLNGYVFVRIRDAETDQVLQSRGVVSFVRCEGRVALVRDDEVARLKQLVTLGYHLEATGIERHFSSGDKVTICSGVLRGLEGEIIEEKDQSHLLVLLESLGQCIRVRLPKGILTSSTYQHVNRKYGE